MNKKGNFGIKYIFFFVLMITTAVGLNSSATAAAITDAQVVDCIDDGGSLICAEKTVIGVTVSHGNEVTLKLIPELPGELSEITISKSEPVYYSPLKHFHTVNYNPCEKIIPVENSVVGIQSCIDNAALDNTTCGWAYSGEDKIDDSQGFCSNKNLEMWTDILGLYRGEGFLERESTVLDSFSIGHCLRMGELYYDGYEIGSPVLNYEVLITLVQESTIIDALSLSPADPVTAYSRNNEMLTYNELKVELLGDIGKPNPGVPELDNYILYIPSAPDTHPYVQNYQNNMLLVPREEVSKDGGELDKVGVSFYAFRHLNGDIRVTQAGDGLHNQLYNKHNGDLMKLSANPNAEADYLLHGKKDFRGMDFVPGMKKVLEYRDTAISNSLVNLVIDPPPQFGVVETEVPGNISNAYVETFTSMSNEGTMNVTIQNVGSAKADYLVTVTDCSENILDAVPAQALTLAMGDQQNLRFNIHTRDNLETTNLCTVSLKSHTGTKFDEVLVLFDTEKHDPKYSMDLQQTNDCSTTADVCECEGNFDDDQDQDGSDAANFKLDFGRSAFFNPCTNEDSCNGDFDCDVDVDGTDAAVFKEDFGRSPFSNPCPYCPKDPWCSYP